MRTILIISLTLALTGCGRNAANQPLDESTSDRHLDEDSFDAAALAIVQRHTGIQLPDGSRGLKMFYQGSTLNPAFVAKIQIPVASGDELAGRLEKIQSQNATVSGALTSKVTWWNPSSGVMRVQRQFTPGGDHVLAILIQEKDRLVLYLEWMSI